MRLWAVLLGLWPLTLGAFELPKAEAVFGTFPEAQVTLGQLLFYDPILSGNREVACATCHHPRFGTSDGVSLAIGDGGIGLGPDRRVDPDNPPEQRLPRNAPALFNLGASEFTVMFHDGRLEADSSRASGLRTPLEDDMVSGFDSVLSAQAMFPVLSPDEMAGHYGENEISIAVRRGVLTGPGGAWDLIAQRVAAIPDYRAQFDAVIGPDNEIGFTDLANALAAFIAVEWRADNSAFDRYLRGEVALPGQASEGLTLFYGKAACGTCHAGQFQTDHGFHAIALPQIGPGKAERFENHARDLGRMRVTGQTADAYRFRTPSLRNIFATAPYGHNGAFATVEAMLRHHLDAERGLAGYALEEAVLPALPGAVDDRILTDASEMQAIAAANALTPISLSEDEIAALIAFLETLTDPESLAGRMGIPEAVPSGLPVLR